jgi:catechol 2,3-dioxygenase-like lactoylglutathione lyase family enzyme
MLSSPQHAVLGAIDVEALVAFLRRFGFAEEERSILPAPAAAALYGLDAPARQIRLGVPGASRGWIRIVETPHAPSRRGPFDRGPHAVDLYTRDIRRSVALAAEAGASCGPIGAYSVGPLAIEEAKVTGPAGLPLVFIQVARRRPSALDRDAERLHSEVHSIVWAVDSLDASLPFWRDRAGLRPFLDATIREPAVARFMGLPRPEAPVRLAMMADAEVSPARLEILEFPEDPGAPAAGLPLREGLHAPAFRVDDLERAIGRLSDAGFGPVASLDGARAVSGVAPGDVRFELWQ